MPVDATKPLDFKIRSLAPNDDIVAITAMLHRAYAPLAAAGLRYLASHQSPDVTARRLARGHALVAEAGARLVGTITAYGPDPNSSAPLYREPDTYSFGQFGIEPEFKGRGVGRSLHEAVLNYAQSQRARFLSLDTAAGAGDLIATYQRWGYVLVGRMKWKSVNYESVLMRRNLCAGLDATGA